MYLLVFGTPINFRFSNIFRILASFYCQNCNTLIFASSVCSSVQFVAIFSVVIIYYRKICVEFSLQMIQPVKMHMLNIKYANCSTAMYTINSCFIKICMDSVASFQYFENIGKIKSIESPWAITLNEFKQQCNIICVYSKECTYFCTNAFLCMS